MNNNDITKKMATEVAKIFNKEILDDDSQIKTGRSAKIDDIKQDIVVAGEQLVADDKDFFTDKQIEIMRAIGVVDLDELLELDASFGDDGEGEGEPEATKEENNDSENKPDATEGNDAEAEEERPEKKPKKGKKTVTESTAKKKSSGKKKAEKPKNDKAEKPKKKAAEKKEKKKEKAANRAEVFAELIYEKKAMTKEQIIKTMTKRYKSGKGSERQSKLSVDRYIRLLEAMNLFDIDDGKYTLNI